MPKSKIKASEGKANGLYPFFTSSNLKVKRIDEFLFNDELIIIGTGGLPSCNYYDGKFGVSTDNFVLKSKGNILPKYLYYYLRNNNLRILADGFRGTGLKHISKDYVSKIEIPFASIDKQELIVKVGNSINTSIEKCQSELNYLNMIVKSRFMKLFGNPQTNPFGLPLVYPEAIAKRISAGGDKPADMLEKCTDEYCYPVYSNGEKDDGLFGWSKEYRINEPAITISGRGTIGYSAYRKDGKFTPIVRLISLIPNNKINPIYLTYYLNIEREKGTGSGVQQLTVPMLKQKKIMLPELNKQNEFASFVEQIDKLKFSSFVKSYIFFSEDRGGVRA